MEFEYIDPDTQIKHVFWIVENNMSVDKTSKYLIDIDVYDGSKSNDYSQYWRRLRVANGGIRNEDYTIIWLAGDVISSANARQYIEKVVKRMMNNKALW